MCERVAETVFELPNMVLVSSKKLAEIGRSDIVTDLKSKDLLPTLQPSSVVLVAYYIQFHSKLVSSADAFSGTNVS